MIRLTRTLTTNTGKERVGHDGNSLLRAPLVALGVSVSLLAGSLLAANSVYLLKMKLAPFHIHAHSSEGDTLHTKTESLFGPILSAQLDGPARADYAMPGQSGNLLQDSHYLARSSRPARRLGYRSVTRHPPRRQGANAAHDAGLLIAGDHVSGFGLRLPIHESAFTERKTMLA